MKITLLPKSKLGICAASLLLLFFLLLGASILISDWQGYVASQTIFDNLPIAIPMVFAIACALASFITGLIAVLKSKERSVLIFITTIVGLFFTLLFLGEILFPH
ncbi:hypothetical protein [Acetanaerobacterium elongatum]|uniref:Uncharacterized protein n=1 Tax=Acetanaerobacterium elongatum TaxID=258515 RepID=A0A1H0DU00_9FIRM|nr:hypothetical protein [Acetanaerobacterium elongatum]SDN73674.1 hypothetical protein SAMN05192585_13024 [Acetanaerobacterium elongatum]